MPGVSGSGELRIARRLDLDEIASNVDAHPDLDRSARPHAHPTERQVVQELVRQDHAGTDDADIGQPLGDV